MATTEQQADNDMCWICLEEAAENGSHQLVSPCKCPRKVHPQCLARWQLQQAGRHEEKFCRFCNNELADWKRHLTPEELKPEVSKVQPIMVVYFEGQIHRIPVKQGPDGLDEFTGKIRELFRLPEDVDISLTFGCKEPMSGSHLKLEGMGAFDAAVHCASVAAAERQQKIKKSYSTGNLGSTPAPLTGGGPDGMARSASINMPAGGGGSPRSPTAISAAAAAMSPATPPPAAGASAATNAAQGRRQAFPAQQQQHQQQQQQRGGAGGMRSRSFSAFNSAGPRSTSAEPPAAFRSILGMLNNSSGTAASGGAQQAAQGGSGAAAVGRPVSPSPQPQASPRAGLPPPSPVRQQLAGSEGSGSPVAADAEAHQQHSHSNAARQHQLAACRRERLSLRQISELKDVPEADETVAVGSLSGKFKLTLKAFSRKVARSLSFNNGNNSRSGSPGAGSSGNSAASFAGSSFTVNSSSASMAAASYTAPAGNAVAPSVDVPAYGRAASPLPPTTPPSIYSC